MPAPSWSELDESRKESSRAHARDITGKLDRLGCHITPIGDPAAPQFRLTPAELEILAVAEHDRWVDERRRAGWTVGEKDPEHKTTPYLVPFTDLPPHIAEYDRILVRAIPELLATVGLRVVRVRSTRAHQPLRP